MSFIQMLSTFALLSTIEIWSWGGIRQYWKFNEKITAKRKETECCRFVAESFKNTCQGKGFESLNEWQNSCRALWKLQYIGWSEAGDFMIVSGKNESILYYGKWIGEAGDGEIYSESRINF